MNRIPWTVILSLLIGLGLGLVYSWIISPVRVIDSEPVALRADFKDQYRASIAAAFAASGNLDRAQARLNLLGDADPVTVLNAQAQQMLASGDFKQADQIAVLSFALQSGFASIPVHTSTSPAEVVDTPFVTIPTFEATPTSIQEGLSPTTEFIPTNVVIIEATLRPTRTPIPTQGLPFTLIGQESICDANLPDGLLQVFVFNRNRRQLAGVEIRITWNGGEDQFFTGLKPELGNGYADFIMTPDVAYTVQLARGSDIASALMAPSCQAPSGESFSGGFKLTFQQP